MRTYAPTLGVREITEMKQRYNNTPLVQIVARQQMLHTEVDRVRAEIRDFERYCKEAKMQNGGKLTPADRQRYKADEQRLGVQLANMEKELSIVEATHRRVASTAQRTQARNAKFRG